MKTIIEMAREAGIRDCTCNGTKGCLDRFAELVRADERARMLEQPAQQQEPVAWMSPSWIDPDTRGWQSDSFESIPIEGWLPIYTSPPTQRTWVGLTDEEILQTLDLVAYDTQAFDFAYRIESKLKEKNT